MALMAGLVGVGVGGTAVTVAVGGGVLVAGTGVDVAVGGTAVTTGTIGCDWQAANKKAAHQYKRRFLTVRLRRLFLRVRRCDWLSGAALDAARPLPKTI